MYGDQNIGNDLQDLVQVVLVHLPVEQQLFDQRKVQSSQLQ
jgi:hypothetical protein